MNLPALQQNASPAMVPHEAALALLDEYLGPARELHRARELIESAFEGSDLVSPGYLRSCRPEARADWMHQARANLESIPALEELRRMRTTFRAAASEQVQPPGATVLLGMMLDGFRTRPTDSTPVYLGAVLGLVADPIDDYGDPGPERVTSSASLAWAIRRLWRTNTFPPSASEVVAACRKAEEGFLRAARAMQLLIDRRRAGEELLRIAAEIEVAA